MADFIGIGLVEPKGTRTSEIFKMKIFCLEWDYNSKHFATKQTHYPLRHEYDFMVNYEFFKGRIKFIIGIKRTVRAGAYPGVRLYAKTSTSFSQKKKELNKKK